MTRPLVVLSNREPYRHDHTGSITTTRSVSGVVTALEPVLLRRGGLWIAQGGGSADAEVVNERQEIAIPGCRSFYRLRRVFLSQNEIAGHTDGFANRTLWPLCHLIDLPPVYEPAHWAIYQRVNEIFASSILEDELAQEPMILVQDFHLALVPALIRARQPQARIAACWHVPWPEPNRLERCPWSAELIHGLLGAQVIAVHSGEDARRLLESAARSVRCRIDWAQGLIEHDEGNTRIRAIPAGIEPEPTELLPFENRREFWKSELGIDSEQVGIAVDRVDFTKGLLERMEALDLLLQRRPSLKGRVTLVQVAPPCRGGLEEYRKLEGLAAERARALNARHEARNPAVIWIAQAEPWSRLAGFYQMADHCLATPIHDGMNLVAKEYIWCQHHGSGELILSRFAGASRQLPEARLINPHDRAGFASAWEQALEAPIEERRERMSRMRPRILSDTSSRWADSVMQELERSC